MKRHVARAAAGLAIAAGTLLQPIGVAGAQIVPPPASDIPVPPAPAADTVRPDTVQPPIGRAPAPRTPTIGGAYVWEGDGILGSGAFTLADLLHRVPEITIFRTGWIHSPQYAAIAGDVSRIRLFLDGIELDAIDPRELGYHELGRRPLWSLQRVAIERVGSEIRVDMRSWDVLRTSPYTRTDVYTGTEETDFYRGYYGKRFGNGAVLQFGGEQGGTENVRFGGGGDAASILTRLGVGRSSWSLDVFAERRRHHRTEQVGEEVVLPPYDATHTVGYARLAIGRALRGPFVELVASTQGTNERSPHREAADTVDTAVSRAQYIATAGYRAGPLVVSVTDRIRRLEGKSENAFSGRAEFFNRFVEASAQAENGSDHTTVDGTVRLQPLRFVSLLASGSRRTSDLPDDTTTTTAFRVEGGVSLTGIWLYGGALAIEGGPPPIHPLDLTQEDPEGVERAGGRRTATFVGLRGRGWRGLGAHAYVIRWDDPGLYMPEYQARTEINFHTQWLRRFPRGQFEFHIAVADEFRSGVDFLTERVGASHILWGLMEIRIIRATLTLQVRNPLGKQYFLVPGFEMPRAVSNYGVRWYFWG